MVVFITFVQILRACFVSKQLYVEVSGLDLHCLPISKKWTIDC